MKHACSVCNKVFNNRDAVIKMSPAIVQNANAAYMSLDESFDDEDIIHDDCLRNYVEIEKLLDIEILDRVESPKAANSLLEPIRNDQVDNAIAGLKILGVAHNQAVNGIEKLLKESPNLTTQEILYRFNYNDQ